MKKALSIILVFIMLLSVVPMTVLAVTPDEAPAETEIGTAVTGAQANAGSVEKAITWAIKIANDDTHGYSQKYRTGPDYDCSSFVCTAFNQAGFDISSTLTTYTMKNAFVKAGFTWIPASSIADFPAKSTNLKRGDILLATEHTELYIGSNKTVAAHGGTYSKYDEGHQGDQTGREIRVDTYWNFGCSGVLRYNTFGVDLGEKFYAHILVTANKNLAVAATDGNNVELAEYDRSDYQMWLFERDSDNSYRITNVKLDKCMDVNRANKVDGTNIKVYTNSDNSAQRYFIIENGSGYRLVPRLLTAGNIEIADGNIAAGANIQLWTTQNSGDGQRFSIVKTVDYTDLGSKFYARILAASNNGFAVAATSSENIQLEKAGKGDYQKWLFERDTDCSYKITNVKLGKCMDVSGGKKENSTNIRVYVSNDTNAQRYFIVKNGIGYNLVPRHLLTGAVDIADGTIASGTNIQLWTIQNNTNAQRFKVEKLTYDLDYSPNGADGAAEKFTFADGEAVTIRENSFSKEGQTFAGYYLYRAGDDSWYTVNGKWVKADELQAASQQRKLFIPGEQIVVGPEWTDGVKPGSAFTLYAQWKTGTLTGDVDGDGEVTIIDATAIQRRLAGIPTKSYDEKAADVDNDPGVTILDATFIQRWLAGLPSNDNIGKPV